MGCSSFFFLALPSILVLLQLQLHLNIAQTYVSPLECSNTTSNYTINSTFEANLNLLLSSISNNTGNNSRYYAGSVGRSPDTVYGVFQCRGDLEPQDCKKCAETAAKDIKIRCPNKKQVTLWYDECTMRYSNKLRLSSLIVNPKVCYAYGNNVTNALPFRSKLNELMNELVVKAANNQTNKFAMDEKNVTESQTIYGLVQCAQDLSGGDCVRCLNGSIGMISHCGDGQDQGKIFTPSCMLRFEIYSFFESDLLLPSLLSLSNTMIKQKGQKKSSRNTLIIIVVIVVVTSSLSLIAVFCYLKKRKQSHISKGVSTDKSLKYDLRELVDATDNFSESNKLGEGGFGVVYKGRINVQDIAVKRLSTNSGQGAEGFKNEVQLLAKLEHKNLVRLLGFCLDGNEKLLIYEFIENASLDQFIFDPIKRTLLDWEARYNIIQGIARGLLYLHEDSPNMIIHRDLKASNILLDAQMNPKISDFGQARLFSVDQTQGRTHQIVGSQGYTAPEDLLHGHFSVKSDVFSFGVLILEIITGQRNSSGQQAESHRNLLSYAWRLWESGNASELLDPILRVNYSRNEVMQCIQMGLLCVQEDPARRPTPSSIVLMLNSYSFTLATPSAPAFFAENKLETDP